MSAKSIFAITALSATIAALVPAAAGAGDAAQHQDALQATSCVVDLFPKAELLPSDFCRRSPADRLRILQQLADETEIAAPAAKLQIEVYAAKNKTNGPPVAVAAVVPTGGKPDIKKDDKEPAPVAAGPTSLPIISRIHARDNELVAEAFIPGVGNRRLRKDSPLPDGWHVYSITDVVTVTNDKDPTQKIALPSSTPMPVQRVAPAVPAGALPSLDAELQRQAVPAPQPQARQ